MLGFSPFKKHANAFNYTPRYYDPRKEGRGGEYRVGQYLERASELRAERRDAARKSASKRMWGMIVAGVFLVIFLTVGYPRVVAFFTSLGKEKKPYVEEFNPYTPITVVPNDYPGAE